MKVLMQREGEKELNKQTEQKVKKLINKKGMKVCGVEGKTDRIKEGGKEL